MAQQPNRGAGSRHAALDYRPPLSLRLIRYGLIGIVGAAAAVVNAVYHATGVRVRDLPVTLDKVFPGLP